MEGLDIWNLILFGAAIWAFFAWLRGIIKPTHRTDLPERRKLFDALAEAERDKTTKLKQAEEKIDAAPCQFVQELDKLILLAITEGPKKAVVNARAIVAARNSLRSSLVTISSLLNSEIDQLALNIGQPIDKLEITTKEPPFGQVDPNEVFQTIEVLSR